MHLQSQQVNVAHPAMLQPMTIEGRPGMPKGLTSTPWSSHTPVRGAGAQPLHEVADELSKTWAGVTPSSMPAIAPSPKERASPKSEASEGRPAGLESHASATASKAPSEPLRASLSLCSERAPGFPGGKRGPAERGRQTLELLMGDAWEGFEDVALECLAEWIADFQAQASAAKSSCIHAKGEEQFFALPTATSLGSPRASSSSFSSRPSLEAPRAPVQEDWEIEFLVRGSLDDQLCSQKEAPEHPWALGGWLSASLPQSGSFW